MLHLLSVVRHVFWNDNLFDKFLLPPEADLEKCQTSLADLATMTGRERIAVFEECGIHSSLHPVFLRALQSLTSIHGSGSIVDNYMLHPHLSAHHWSPSLNGAPLLGYSFVNSEAFATEKPEERIPRPKGKMVLNSGGANSKTKYNGLLNQGATCYLNSLLQALFHISEFRWTIYQMPTGEEGVEKNDMGVKRAKSIPYALQRLFCLLQRGSEAVDTTELTESFGWSATDSFIQHDVHEMTCTLLDNLENKLNQVQQPEKRDSSPSTKKNAISQLFVGVLENFVCVDEVDYHGSREELFYDIQLLVKDTTDIYTSFERLFQVEVLDGKNKYCLENNGTKSYHRAEKGVRLKRTPPILLLHLARFDYDIEKGETKVLSRWDYYNNLDLSKYMPHASKEDTNYTLCSVLVHSGSDAGFGHYFCFLRCSNAWYRFNDEIVSPASLREVFGANFGGFELNYWGSEVPNTTNAYMLVYVRTSEMGHLLRPIAADEVPWHVVRELEWEQTQYERLLKEQAEDHLYGRIYFLQPCDIEEEQEFLSCRRPRDRQFPSNTTLRILLSTEALPAFKEFVEKQLGIPSSEQLLWYSAARGENNHVRLHKQVVQGITVADILCGEKESCVFVITPSNANYVEVDEDGEDDAVKYELFHHKLYIPLRLKVVFLGSTVLVHRKTVASEKAIALMEPFIRKRIAEIPPDKNLKPNHHLGGGDRSCIGDSETLAAPFSETPLGDAFTPSSGERAGKKKEALSVLCESEYNTYSKCSPVLDSGDILVWQEPCSEEDKSGIFYPDIVSFQHFLRRRVPVEIKLNLPPSYPTLIDTQLAETMTYEHLQRYVARLIGDPLNYDRIRFTMHNPETKLPYFMKGRRAERPTLGRLLSPPVQRREVRSRYLYYEYCKYAVTEIEAAHSLQFKLFSERVKPISQHWVLLPLEAPITPKELFRTCVKEIQEAKPSGISSFATTSVLARSEKEREGQPNDLFDADMKFYRELDPEDAWQELRLVDVWRGRIYNLFDKDHPHTFGHSTFEESAEYRIEQIPRHIEGIPPQNQSLIHVHHFTLVRQRSNSVETHGDPFSIYIDHAEFAPDLLRRIAYKLGLSEAAVVDWKMALVKENYVVEVRPNVPLGRQLFEFCLEAHYLPNQQYPLKMAFLGLEHAPLLKSSVKRGSRVVILN
ncbi:putative cysteine peptidase, Clan CA, family C19 [Trypanosoma conorhini]|uniref:ubiquitinyl hydrolase 1 n=1 Tax=Trypanosoma conorhini TaxID=83891 RepID=A0A422ND36_9TRYP|nr:putative cysteine peptidase, Clan CA, family C19 [Trypanosoma conorhini]RNF03414.1 putative cysteine peptidase, Clan CA, family C19 [Trypanosoma conorhini]